MAPCRRRGGAARHTPCSSSHATGDILYFTDADTRHHRHSVSWAVANLQAHQADLLSGYPSQELASAGEALVVPAMYLMTALILPLPLVRMRVPKALSFAVGQVMVFRRKAFEAIGGYAAVRNRISEDLAIARVAKSAGFRTVFLDAGSAIRCRMYSGYRAAVEGISKNTYDAARNGRGLFAFGMTALAGFVLLPLALAAASAVRGAPVDGPLLLSTATFLLAWAVTLYDRGHEWWLPLAYPVLFLHLLAMVWGVLRPSASRNGIIWKGRVLR